MFSEKFYLTEHYDLDTKEYLASYQKMGCEFTSLCYDIYKPELSTELKEKFKNIIDYKFYNSSVPFNKEETFFGIKYCGGDILEYDVRTVIDYNLIRPFREWEKFVMSCGINRVIGLKETIDKKLMKTDIMTNYVTRMTFDVNGQITGISVVDLDYDETKPNSDINFVDKFEKKRVKYENVLKFNVDGTFSMSIWYSPLAVNGKFIRSGGKTKYVLDQKNFNSYNEESVIDMVEYGILSEEEAEYVRSHLHGERRFIINFDFDKNENITKKTLEIVTHDLFQEL